MDVFIERLCVPVSRQWNRFLSPLQQSMLGQISASHAVNEGDLLAFGVQVVRDQDAGEIIDCGLLLSKVIVSLNQKGKRSLILSIISLSFVSSKVASALGPLLLQHSVDFALEQGCSGVHIGWPREGHYGGFVRQLTSSREWSQLPGKVVVRLSDVERVGPLLSRLERSVERKMSGAQWRIEPYQECDVAEWQDRIRFSRQNFLGVPWDPDDLSYSWEPSIPYSRVLKNGETIIGWLICHFLADDTLRYGKLWVDPSWEQSGAPLALLCSVMRAAHFQPRSSSSSQVATGYPIPKGCFISHPSNRKLHRLMIQKFKPVCDSWTELDNYYLNFDL